MADKNTVEVDFTGVESGGGFDHLPEGDYPFVVKKSSMGKGTDSGVPYIQLIAVVKEGKLKGKSPKPIRLSLGKKALWKLRSFLEACGKKVPQKAIKINILKMVGWEFAGTVSDDDYEGKKGSEITSFFLIEELGKATGAEALDEAGDDLNGEETESSEEGGDDEELFS